MSDFRVGDLVKLEDYSKYPDHEEHMNQSATVIQTEHDHGLDGSTISVRWADGTVSTVWPYESRPYKVSRAKPDRQEQIENILKSYKGKKIGLESAVARIALECLPADKPSSADILEKLMDLADKHFPKGECKERGSAIVLVAEMFLYFEGTSDGQK